MDTQIHTQNLNLFFFINFKLSYSKFARDLQNTQILKKLKLKPKLRPFSFFRCISQSDGSKYIISIEIKYLFFPIGLII
jgi:hypothetical protein